MNLGAKMGVPLSFLALFIAIELLPFGFLCFSRKDSISDWLHISLQTAVFQAYDYSDWFRSVPVNGLSSSTRTPLCKLSQAVKRAGGVAF